MREAPAVAAGPRLFMSTAISGDIASRLGSPHYSYYFAAARFSTMFANVGRTPCLLPMPEYYATRAAMPEGMHDGDIHLIFRSTEQIRLLKPARANICCFAWEFPVIKTTTLPGEHPFTNQLAMLQLCDEVWVPSTYAQEVLRAHGVSQTYKVPAPIELPRGRRRSRAAAISALGQLRTATLDINFAWPEAHQTQRSAATCRTLADFIKDHAAASARPTIFLSILNPEDFRKNLDSLLRGFHALRQQNPAAILIVKALTSQSRFDLAELAGGVIRNKLSSGTTISDPGIAIINAFLSEDEMSALYHLADFYLCTSLAEGQNLPLLEAMAHGTVAISTRNTAMIDYITDDNAFVVPHEMIPNRNPHLAGCIAAQQFDVAFCTARHVYLTLQRAMRADAAQRTRMRHAAIGTVTHLFGEPAVWTQVQRRLRALNPG